MLRQGDPAVNGFMATLARVTGSERLPVETDQLALPCSRGSPLSSPARPARLRSTTRRFGVPRISWTVASIRAVAEDDADAHETERRTNPIDV